MDILDKATLAAVIAASPDIPGDKENAGYILEILQGMTEEGAKYSSALVQDIADTFNRPVDVEKISASRVGSLMRRVGLSGQKTRDGYRYYWTKEQLDILAEALTD
jgi:hypothetical protein